MLQSRKQKFMNGTFFSRVIFDEVTITNDIFLQNIKLLLKFTSMKTCKVPVFLLSICTERYQVLGKTWEKKKSFSVLLVLQVLFETNIDC